MRFSVVGALCLCLSLSLASTAAACTATQGTAVQRVVCGIVHAADGGFSWSKCRSDFRTAEEDFDAAIRTLRDGIDRRSKSRIEDGLKEFAGGLRNTGAALDDCKLATIAEDLAKLASHFASGFGEVEEAIKIIVKGFDVYDDVYDIVEDHEHKRYYEMGEKIYSLAKLLA